MIAWLGTLRLGARSLMLHKLRSALTTLGILFGVASVIAMLAVGEGASSKAQEDIRELGATNIILRSRKPPEGQTTQQTSIFQAQIYGLTYKDADVISATIPSVEVVVPMRELAKDVWADARHLRTSILGTVPHYSEVSSLHVREGRWLSPFDMERSANMAVLTDGASRALFPVSSPLGRSILAGTERFVVVGVLEPRRGGGGGGGGRQALRDAIYVPLSTMRSWFGETVARVSAGSSEIERVELHQIHVKVPDDAMVIPVADVVRNILKRNHRQEDYEVVVPLELLRKAEEQRRMFNLVLGLIAGISLLVGGIGIMNVMLATVTERTREIGIRRALGARRRHIVAQFLVETVVLSAGGGLLGVALGTLLPALVTRFTEFVTIVRPEFAALAFGISALVGILAGIYPAVRAAAMDPVEALRHE